VLAEPALQQLLQAVDFELNLCDPRQLSPLLGFESFDFFRVPRDGLFQVVVSGFNGNEACASVSLSPIRRPTSLV
jgi:hypothetical protein